MGTIFKDIVSCKRSWLLFLPLLLLYSCSYFQRTAVPGTIYNQLSLAIGQNNVPALGPYFIWIYSLSQLAIGIFVDRYSAKKVVMIGGIMFCTGVTLFPLLNSPAAMYAVRMLAGLGAGTMYLSVVRESDRLFGRENYSVMMGVVFVVGYGGGLLGTLPFGRLVEYFGWRPVLLAVGIFASLCYLWFFAAYWSESSGQMVGVTPRNLSVWQQLKRLIQDWRNWAAMIGGTINFAAYFSIQTVFGKKFLTDVPGMSEVAAETVVFAMTLVCMVTLFSSSLLTRLLGNRRRPLMFAAAIIELCATLTVCGGIWLNVSGWWYAIGFAGFAVASGMLIVYTLTAQELASQETMTQSAGLCNMVNYCGAILLTVAASLYLKQFASSESGIINVYPVYAYKTIFTSLLIPAVCGVLLILVIPETRGKFQQH